MKLWRWFKAQPTGGKIAVGIAVVVVLIGIGAALEGEDNSPEPVQAEPARETPAEATEATEEELTAELLVDVMEGAEPANIRNLCRAEDSLGEGIVFTRFEQGYTRKKPSAEEVFEEVMARC